MAKKLKSIVNLSPGFVSAVNLKQSIDDEEKASAYIPTEVASEVISDLAENLHPLAKRRSRLLTGTYGTGKSHLALVIAHLYRDGTQTAVASRLLEKLQKWPFISEKLDKERSEIEGKFLPVLLEADEGEFDDSLLRRLDEALMAAGLDNVLPETAFEAAIGRIGQLQEEYPDYYARLKDIVNDYGFESVDALIGQLKNKQRSAYDAFDEIHQALFGLKIPRHHLIEPKDVFPAVAKALIDEKGYAGILVIWDEFCRYMERIVEDPRGVEGEKIQKFADCCNTSLKNQLHLYLICHRSLQEYVNISSLSKVMGMTTEDESEWKKISGRFREFQMVTTDHEVFNLIDQIIVQKDGKQEWQDFILSSKDYFDDLTDKAYRLKLFPEFDRAEIGDVVTIGSYPLHPMAAFCLPQISQKVAQSERTLFKFLSDSGSDTLGPFLEDHVVPEKGGSPPLFTADCLWDYFLNDAERHPIYRRTVQKYSLANVQIDPEDQLGKKIIRAVALISVINTDRAPCTEEVLSYTLCIKLSDQDQFREALKALCGRTPNRGAVLVQQQADGSYRFTGAPTDDFDEKAIKIADDRFGTVSPIRHLRTILDEVGVEDHVPAHAYSDDFDVERALNLELVDYQEFQDKHTWIKNLGDGQFIDGFAFVVLCDNGDEIRRAKELALADLNHPQILIGIPKEPLLQLFLLLRKHEAIKYLETEQGNLYGVGAELRDEWEQQERDYITTIKGMIGPLLDPQNRLMSWFLEGTEVESMGSISKLKAVASEMMYKVFPNTPKISLQRLTTETGKDSYIASRRAILDKLLLHDGPEQLAKETSARDKAVIEAVYKRNGILRQSGSQFKVGNQTRTNIPP